MGRSKNLITPELINKFGRFGKFRLKNYVNDIEKYVYFQIPKNASRTMRRIMVLRKNCDYVHFWSHFNNRTSKHYEEYKLKAKYFKFTVLREPLDRAVSSYLELCERRKREPIYKAKTEAFYSIKDPYDKFNSYINELEKGFFDGHHCPQLMFICDHNFETIEMDLVILMEKLNEGYATLCRCLNWQPLDINSFPDKVLHKKSRRDKDAIYELLVRYPHLRDTLIEIYKVDFRMYNEAIQIQEQ